jgi:hypothetical protein
MKKVALFILLILPLGCKTLTSNTPPSALAPGALNAFDQQAYQTLSAAHAFAVSASGNAATLTTTEKADLNSFIAILNTADVLYQAYHAGTATQAQVQTQLNAVATSQATFSSAVTGETH